jgi:threonine dehydratase
MSAEPTLEDIQRAAAQIRGLIHRTPVMTSRLFDEAAGVSCFFKCENLQRGGSFKMRGAAYFVSSLPEAERRHGVVTYSSGNHGQAVAIAAEHFGIPATVVMPEDAPKAKIDSTRAHGAKIVTYDRSRESREEMGQNIAKESGASIVPPYDHPWTITGQGTAVMELLEEVPDLDAVLVCLGGGGLLAGSAIAARGMKPSIQVFGVEPELANDWALSLQQNKRIEIAPPPTIADGLRTQKPGEVTFPIVQRLATGALLVSEDKIRATIRFLLTRMKLVVEPSGAVAAAAALHGKPPKGLQRVGIVITGGNIDMKMLSEICGCSNAPSVD